MHPPRACRTALDASPFANGYGGQAVFAAGFGLALSVFG